MKKKKPAENPPPALSGRVFRVELPRPIRLQMDTDDYYEKWHTSVKAAHHYALCAFRKERYRYAIFSEDGRKVEYVKTSGLLRRDYQPRPVRQMNLDGMELRANYAEEEFQEKQRINKPDQPKKQSLLGHHWATPRKKKSSSRL
jgi:hypothetical protein